MDIPTNPWSEARNSRYDATELGLICKSASVNDLKTKNESLSKLSVLSEL
jgi:hypothetical protein